MIGLEKVTGRILSDAEADARAALGRADAECASISAAYDERLRAALAESERLADRERRAVLTRARSAAAMAKRSAILEARSRLVSEAYAAAADRVARMTAEEYLGLLLRMLRGALRRQTESERENLRLGGEDTAPDAYEVLLNAHDRAVYGESLLTLGVRSLRGRADDAVLDRLSLAAETADIDGGLILRCGQAEINCSLSVVFAEARRATEAKVSRILFGEDA